MKTLEILGAGCPKCRKHYDITLFQYGKKVICECGEQIDARKGHTEPLERPRRRDHRD